MRDPELRRGRRARDVWDHLQSIRGAGAAGTAAISPWAINTLVRVGAHLTNTALQSLNLSDVTNREACVACCALSRSLFWS